MPGNGVMAPDGGAGWLRPSGLEGIMRAGRPGMWMRFASLLYDAGMICETSQHCSLLQVQGQLASMISSLGKWSFGISVALQAMR